MYKFVEKVPVFSGWFLRTYFLQAAWFLSWASAAYRWVLSIGPSATKMGSAGSHEKEEPKNNTLLGIELITSRRV